MPSQEDGYLSVSPMGKVPAIETASGGLSETSVILEYLEDLGQGANLYPQDPFEKARVRELVKELELYVELPARTCFPEAFFGGSVSDEVKARAKTDLAKGIAALRRNGKFAPFVAGAEFTAADIMFQYSVPLAVSVGKRIFGEALLEDFPAAAELIKTLGTRASAQQVAADQKAG